MMRRFVGLRQSAMHLRLAAGAGGFGLRHQPLWRRARSLLVGLLAVLAFLAASGDAAWAGKASSTASGIESCNPLTKFRSTNFPKPTRINNKWFALVPGTQFVYEGRANRGGGVLPHTVVFTVTDLVKIVDGVKTRVIWDRDLNEGQLQEAELAFFAQDASDNIWTVGEYPEEYENGKFVGADSTWIGGNAGAKPGVLIPGNPKLGTPAFRQGYAKKIGFYDCGQVYAKGQSTTVPTGTYHNVTVVDEWSPLDPESGHQRKDYAPGVGLVRVGAVNDPEGETLVLSKVVNLDAYDLTEARNAVLKLEKRAYKISAVYQDTEPVFQER
jgi:hypothetical protein